MYIMMISDHADDHYDDGKGNEILHNCNGGGGNEDARAMEMMTMKMIIVINMF
jgi:hypothetical protein